MYLKSTTYVIVDDDLDLTLEIDVLALENPKFDLIKWYLHHVRTVGKFCDKYLEQRHEYQSGNGVAVASNGQLNLGEY